MRITKLHATPVAVPFRADEVWAFGRRRGVISVLIDVETDEGIVGIGEAAAYPSVDVVLAVLRDLEPLVIGEDPFAIERLVRRIDLVGTWHHVRASSPAIAAVEMACWDIVGKACGQPLVNLFGGRFRDEVECFYYVAAGTPDAVATEAALATKQGFATCYLKVGSDDPHTDIARVEALRDGAGPNAKLRIDPNEAWSPGEAVRMIRSLERFDLELVEQPVSGRCLDEMAYVRGRVGVPLLANEASWTRHDQLAVIRAGAADVLSADNQMDGGLLNLKRSAGIAEAAGLTVVKHSLGELGVALAASTHVIASTPNFRHANQAYGALLADDVTNGFGGGIAGDAAATDGTAVTYGFGAGVGSYRDGHVSVPTAPGLGVTLDPERVDRYAELYRTDGAAFAFHDPDALSASHALPKR